MLTIRDMDIRRGGATSLRIALPALDLARGEVAALTGVSGCGKSTLLEMIGTILRPDNLAGYQLGDPAIDIAQPLMADDPLRLADVRAQQLGFVLQHGGLLPWLTVQQNILLPQQLSAGKKDNRWLDTVIAQLNLDALLDKQPSQLSIGERQRVSFVRAIAHQPLLLLADEPTAALDPENADRLFRIIIERVKSLNMVAIIVSHDWQRVAQYDLKCYRATVTEAGSVFQLL